MSAMKMLKLAGLSDVQLKRLDEIGYFSAPASKGHHLAYPGGLAEHSVNVTARLVELTTAWGVKWPRPESPYLVGMLHDLVKTKCYEVVREMGVDVGYRYVDPEYPGHGLASKLIAEVELDIQFKLEEHDAIIYHMGSFGVGKEYLQKFLDDALRRSGQFVVAAHAADWYAAAVDEGGEP